MLKKIIPILFAVLILHSPFSIPHSDASEIQLPRTGQTVCYDASGSVISCSGTGQNGAFQAGAHWPTTRLVTNGNGTVTDQLTGLVWLQNANCTDTVGGINRNNPMYIGYLTWGDAITWSNNLANGFCGLTDSSTIGQWRLPNIVELKSLIDAGNNYPALPTGQPFTGLDPDHLYWSSTTMNGYYPDGAWVIAFYNGIGDGSQKSNPSRVWPVRDGGPSVVQLPKTGQISTYAPADDGALQKGVGWNSSRIINNGNGTMTDKLTGLIWLQQAHCKETSGGIPNPDGYLEWGKALTWSNNMAHGTCGLTDGSSAGHWRLPDSNELDSLINRQSRVNIIGDNNAMWLNSLGFITVRQGGYWTSTTIVNQPDTAWYVDMFSSGGRLPGAKGSNGNNYVWPVRGGQFGNSAMSVSPLYKDFGYSAGSQVVTIANTAAVGSSELQINAMVLSGSGLGSYSINYGNGSGGTCGSAMPIIGPGSSCTVTVTFSPTSGAPQIATLRVSGSDVNAPNADISMVGNTTPTTVTANVSGGNGSISSTNPLSVGYGASASFTLAPAANYQPSAIVGGNCPAGSWSGNTYTTGPITAACTADFSFVMITYPLLTISYFGTGGGTVTVLPKPPATIDCTGNCSQSITSNTVVNLTAQADPLSFFSGWTNCPSVSGNTCSLTMTAAKSLSVFFNHTAGTNIKVGSNTFGTINGAYTNGGSNFQISLMAGDYYENLVFGNSVTVRVQGGYDSTFSTISGVTTIHGSLTISGGTVTLGNVVIK